MLRLHSGQINKSFPIDVASTVTSLEEGAALVTVMEGGIAKVVPATGAATEQFIGFAHFGAGIPSVVPAVEEITVPSVGPYTVNLRHVPVANPGVIITNPRTVLVPGVAATATDYAITGSVITLHSSFAGKTVVVTYNYNITLAEATQAGFHFDTFRHYDLVAIPTIGVISSGIVYTDQYDPTVDWTAASGSNPVKLSAGGKVTLGGAGTAIPSVFVAEAPNPDNPFLGLHVNIAG